jgi:signal transduction histidine kinase
MMLPSWLTSVRGRLILYTTLLVGAISLFIFFYIPARVKASAFYALINKASNITEMTAYSVAPALLFEDTKGVAEVLESIKQDEDVIYAVLLDKDGKWFAAVNQDSADFYGYRNLHDRSAVGHGIYRLVRPVFSAPKRIGELYTGFTLRRINEDVAAVRVNIALLALVIFLLGGGAAFSISTIVTRPLRRMVATVERISHGDLAQRARIGSHDEVGLFAAAFNRMVDHLARAHDDLAGVNRLLEEKVTERTRELRTALVEQLQTQAELQQNERFLSDIFFSIQDGISVLNHDLRIVRVNPVVEKWYQHAMPLVGKLCHQAFHLSESPCEICPSRRTLETGQVAFDTVPKRGSRGEVAGSLELYTFPLRNAETGEVTGLIEYVRDITDKRTLEEQFRQAQKMEAVGRLAGGVAHDFNNLLTVISGNVEMGLMTVGELDPIRNVLDEIGKAADRASALTRQLLAFSRKQTMTPRVINLNLTIANMDKMLRRIIGEDVDLLTVPGEQLWSVFVDPGLIEQVIVNLVVNARDAMPKGGNLTIETANVAVSEEYQATHPIVKPGNYVMLAISDTGEGIPENIRPLIFEPFFTTKEAGRGTGLGLATVYGIVKQSNGYIWVYSEIGQGTTFKTYLPMAAAEAEKIEKQEELAEMPRGSETILVVEDEDGVRELVYRILKEQGYSVMDARNGADALTMCRQMKEPVDLVITDVVMPQMNGAELITELRNIWHKFKALYMSGYTGDAIVHNGVLDPGTPYLQKPFLPIQLARKVREILDA